jgi:3-phenylpropionate/trans-cinnamate dioxygenase ferredoxin reductase subunit
MNRLVIVGAGLAGHRAAQSARRVGFDGDLIMIGEELHKPYDRPPLSKQLLAGTMTHEETFYAHEDLEAEWVLGSPATALDTDRNVVSLGNGIEVPYDGLVLCTGRRAREWPDLPDLEGFYTIRNLEHTDALRAEARPGAKAVLVGAGFIGCEVAATLRGLGVQDVTMIDIAPYPMPALGPEVGARAIKLHESHGVKLLMNQSVAGFEGSNGRVSAVNLKDGTRLEADFVLLSLGSLPNTEWLEGSGVQVEQGAVRVDDYTIAIGTDNVAAAGDIALYPHPGSPGEPICIEHWSNARDMGATAAKNLIVPPAQREVFVAVPTFWSDQYDVKIKSAGLLKLADSWKVVEEDPERPSLLVEAYHGDDLVGAVVFNKNRSIIQYQRNLQAALLD